MAPAPSTEADVLAHLRAINDDLRSLERASKEQRLVLADAIAEAVGSGATTYAEAGRAVGLSGQYAHQLAQQSELYRRRR